MRREETFTGFEGYSLLTTTFMFHIFDGPLSETAKHCGNAAWIAVIIGTALSIGLFFLYYLLVRMFDGKDLLQMCEEIFGRFLTRVICLTLCVYFLLYCVNNLLEGVDLLVSNTYTNTRAILIVFSLLLAVAIIASYPIKSMARTASIAVPLFFAAIALILIMAVGQYDSAYLFPLLGYGAGEVSKSGLMQLSNFDGLLIVLVFMGSFGSVRSFKKNGFWAVVTSGLAFSLSAVAYCMSGPYQSLTSHSSGLFDLAKSIYINRFFQRFDAVFIIFVSIGKILVIGIGMIAAKKCFCYAFSISGNHQKKVLPSLALTILACHQILRNTPGAIAAAGDFMRYTSLYFVFAFLVIMLIGAYIRARGGRRKPRAACLLLACCLCGSVFSGCNMITEPDEEVYPIVLGYDRSDIDTLRITMKIMPEDKQSAGGNGGGGFEGQEGAENGEQVPDNVFTVDAPCNLSAAELINTVMPKRVSLIHVKMIVISEELAREDINMLIEPIIRYKEIKSTAALMICRGKAEDYISSKSSELIPFLPLEMEMILKQNKGGTSYLAQTINQVHNNYISSYGDAVIMYSALLPKTKSQANDEGEDPEEDSPDTSGDGGGSMMMGDEAGNRPRQDRPIDQSPEEAREDELPGEKEETENTPPGGDGGYLQGYLPGQIPIKTAIESQIAGMAVFDGPKMVGILNTHETSMFMMADGKYAEGALLVRDPYKPDYYVMFQARNRQKSKVKTRIDDQGAAYIDIHVYMSGELQIVQNTEKDYRNDKEEREKLIEYVTDYLQRQITQVIEKSQREYGSDILRLGRYVAPHFVTIREWEAYNWSSRYPNARVKVTVSFKY